MYYAVLVASPKYHKDTPLTYSFDGDLQKGTLVEVPMQRQNALAIVVANVKKPTFITKQVSKVILEKAFSEAHQTLYDWIKHYYPAPFGMILGMFIPSYLSVDSPPSSHLTPSTESTVQLPPLTDEQDKVIKNILANSARSTLLHGNTGSGKTRVYIELAQKTLANGRSILVLTPEIGLTPQLTKTFEESFPSSVILLHSTMTAKARREAWRKIASSQSPLVVIGPRSALFCPLQNIGLIVVDEMHDSSYKQEQAPYYHATRVAGKLAEIHDAKLILGSATPPVTDYFIFKENKLPILRMESSAAGVMEDAAVSIVDLRDKQNFGRSSWLSTPLLGSIDSCLARNEQVLLFLNRRGTARVILCKVCAWQSTCPRCDLPLTYHGDSHQSICHTCGHRESTPSSCPTCNSEDIIFKSAGTKSVVDELGRLYPKAHVARFDSDLKKSERLENNYASVLDGSVDILVGTQMLGKGLDLPKLGTVGIILADTSLGFPDYTAEERTFQMISQVIGRVGRGHRKTSVTIQTYNPESPILKYAVEKDYRQFYEAELKERKLFHFPPFCYILKLTCSRKSQSAAIKAAETLVESLKVQLVDAEIVGPAPSFIEKKSDTYNWQIVVKSKKRSHLTTIIKKLPSNWTYDIDPTHLL